MKMKLQNTTMIWIGIIVLLMGGVWGLSSLKGTTTDSGPTISSAHARTATIYKSPSCGCCGNYAAYLESQGYDVTVKLEQDMSVIKDHYGIQPDMESCHTMVIDDYFIEGHVPIEAVEQLLTERPDIDGIALPRMPAGSPGMPGVKQSPFQIYGLNDGQTELYTTI